MSDYEVTSVLEGTAARLRQNIQRLDGLLRERIDDAVRQKVESLPVQIEAIVSQIDDVVRGIALATKKVE